MHPDPRALYPIEGISNTVFLGPLLKTKDIGNISVGAFSYYSDFDDPAAFFERNVLYNFGGAGTGLSIGKFCAFAHGAKFILADANHAMSGPSTYPFPIFGGSWAEAMPLQDMPFLKKGVTEIGHDVWIGMNAIIMPGVRIGNGAVIGAASVVGSDVPDYSTVVGNPAKITKQRYSEGDIVRLNELSWWDWDEDTLATAVPALVSGDVDALEEIARTTLVL